MDIMMRCSDIQKKLSAYQDRELKPQEQEKVTKHLLGCGSCREKYEKLERVWQTLGELEEMRPDLGFYRQLVRKIKEPREHGLLPSLQRVFQLLRVPVTVSVILIIGLMAGSYLGSILTRHDLLPSQNDPRSNSQGTFFSSLKAFDPAPPGTFVEGYLRMVSYREDESR